MNIVRLMFLSRQMKNRKHEKDNMVTGIPPLTFIANKTGTLKNYRIYGNTETLTRTYSGSAPLSFPIVDGAVSNYRVYGNTVNGESVGDKTNNLLSVLPGDRTNKGITYENKNNLYMQIAGKSTDVYSQTNGKNIFLQAGTYYIRFFCDTAYKQNLFVLLRHSDNKDIVNEYGDGTKFTLENDENIKMIIGVIQSNVEINTNIYVQIAKDIKPSAFEPYGYRVPVTVNSGTVNIYLDEQIVKSGDDADYIDYATQKRYNADGTSEDVSLPALPAQSTLNSFSVGTIIQPSSVAVDVSEVVSCGDKVTDNQSVNYDKYKIPVTLTAGSAETTDIYLDAPLAKSGNNADYIDYAAQKRHNSDGTESSVTLPEIAVAVATNTLTVGTEVQPSRVELTGKIKEGES